MRDKPKTPPTRRAFVISAGMTAAAAAGAALAGGEKPKIDGAPGILRQRLSLKMVTTWPKNFPGLGTGAERIAKRITEMTGGAIDIRVYAGGELVPALGVFDAVAQGKADIYHGAEYYWQGKNPAYNFFTAVPFGLTASEMNSWIYHGGGQQLWDELSARFNIKPFAGGNTGVQMGGWFKKEIRSLEDLKGLRIRTPGLGGEVLSRLGATPVTKAGGELFLALSQGNIDGTEWVGPWNDMAFGFHTVAPYYYGPGFHEPGSTLSFGMNLDVWENLPKAYKAIIETACSAENDYMLAEFNAENAKALQRLERDHGILMRPFPEEVMQAAARAAGEVLADHAAADPFAERVFDSFKEARDVIGKWAKVSEIAYFNARERGAHG